jgi:transcriptional regulator with XRE-family HTH domain
MRRGLTQEQLAKQAHTTAATVSRWENFPSRVSVATLTNLAKILDVSPSELLVDVREAKATRNITMICGLHGAPDNPFDTAVLESLTQTPAEDLAMLYVKGDAMSPTIHNGDHCLVDTTDKDIYSTGIYCIQIGRTAQPRRLSVNPINGRINIRCDNHTYGDYLDVEPNAVKVIGRVVWLGHKL